MKVLQLLEEKDGKPSFSRWASLVLVTAVVTWVSYVVFKTHTLPDLAPAGIFLSTSLATLYTANKISTAIGGE